MDISPWAELLALSVSSLTLMLGRAQRKAQQKKHDQLRFDATAMDERLSENVRELKQELRECHQDRDEARRARDDVERQNRILIAENLELSRADRNRRRQQGP